MRQRNCRSSLAEVVQNLPSWSAAEQDLETQQDSVLIQVLDLQMQPMSMALQPVEARPVPTHVC